MSSASGVSIGLLGDVMLGRGVAEALRDHPPEALWDRRLRELAASLDLVVCNLECCLSARGSPTTRVKDKPFFFRAPPAAAIEALRAMRVRAVSLANNHALDYGEDALRDTLDALAAAGIAAAGAGRDTESARRPAHVDAGALRVAVVAVTDHPGEYAAGATRPGVAHANLRRGAPDWLREGIAAARERADLVVAFPHWGPNMSTRPATFQHRLAAGLRAAGADLVAGHSAHVFHGLGWDEGPVLYDLGDALDDYATDAELRNDLGVLAVWRPGSPDPIELVGLRLDYCHTRLAAGADADWIARRLERACRALGTHARRAGEQRFLIAPAG